MNNTSATGAVKFNKFYVTNGPVKARVSYSLDNRADGRSCVTLYAKDYTDNLALVIADGYKNDTDFQTDYFDKGRTVLLEGHPLYAAARARAEQTKAEIARQSEEEILTRGGFMRISQTAVR